MDQFSVLQTPEGSACIVPWANPSFHHGVIMFGDGRVEYVPPTDDFASEKHMKGCPGVPTDRFGGDPPFESSEEAAKAYVEWKLIPPRTRRRRTVWERISK